MTLLAPLFLYFAAAAAVAVVALHFIVTRQPDSRTLPTTRFVPRGTVRVTTLSWPRDLLLLAVRVLLLLLVGLAFARPVLVPERRELARIVLADISAAAASPRDVADSVGARLAGGDVLIAFDTATRVLPRDPDATAAALPASGAPARLSPALVAALRAGAALRAHADSIELVIVSTFRVSAFDPATFALRALWPGRITLIHVNARADSLAPPAGVELRATADDPLRYALPPGARGGAVRVVRDAATGADSAWAAEGNTLVRWPAAGAPPGWSARTAVDTPGALLAGDAVLVHPLERRWHTPDAAGVIARWVDGAPAALERRVRAGCIRDVAVPVPQHGDVVLRPAFSRLAAALTAPCAPLHAGPPAPPETKRRLAGDGPLAAADRVAPRDAVVTPLVPWLLAAALLLALVEPWLRRTATRAGALAQDDRLAEERAA